MQHVFKEGFNDFKRSYGKYLSFELIFSLVTSILFAPFLTYVFNKLLIIFRKSPALINNDVLSFGFSLRGMLTLFIIGLLVIVILFVEFGVLIIISHKSYFKQPILISQAFKTALSKLPKLIGVGVFLLFFLMFFLIPWVDMSTFPMFVDINKSIIVSSLFEESFLMKCLYALLFILILYFFIRWIFALHFMFLENQTMWQAMKNSWNITRRREASLFFYIVVLNVIIFLFGLFIMTFVSELASIIDSKRIGHFIGEYLLTITSYVTIILSLFLIPLNIIILTRLLYRFIHTSGCSLTDDLTVLDSVWFKKIEQKIRSLLAKRKAIIRGIIATILSIVFFINYAASDAIVVYLPWDVQVVAHRGDGFHSPENSISAIKSSIEKGIDGVEIDVVLTKDRVMVLSHDEDLDRIANRPERIEDLTFEELQEIDIGKSFDEAFTGERIPTLKEVMELISETETNIVIDVKVDNEHAKEYAKKIVEIIHMYDANELSLVQSFNHTFLQEMRELNPDIEIGQILFLSIGNVSTLDVDFYTIRQTMLTDRFVKEAHKNDRDVWVWTVNNPRSIKEVLKYNIEGIITDYPERVYQLLETK